MPEKICMIFENREKISPKSQLRFDQIFLICLRLRIGNRIKAFKKLFVSKLIKF